MASYKNLLISKTEYLVGLASLLLITVACAAFSFTGADDFDLAKQEIILRKIGHEILLHSGDSTSRVLPVKKIGENEYRITFENEFTFRPDSLEKIVSRELAKDKLAHDYIVNVINCDNKEAVIYGYAIFKNTKDNIVACRGRNQPKGCYLIDIKFQNNGITTSQKGLLLGGLPLLAFIGLAISRSVKTRKPKLEATVIEKDSFEIGNSLFDPKKRRIITGQTITELTAKENKLLLPIRQMLSLNAAASKKRSGRMKA
jgi:hypothetical protein